MSSEPTLGNCETCGAPAQVTQHGGEHEGATAWNEYRHITLKELLDDMLAAGPTIDGVSLLEWMRPDPEYLAARAEIEGFVERISQQVHEERALLKAALDEIRDLGKDLDALRSSMPTAYEAETMLMVLNRKPFKGPEIDIRYEAEERGKAKLKVIASAN